VAEKENRLMVMAKNGYEPLLAKVMNNATAVITGSWC
jgi:Cu/Ag efflux pump CusA